MKTQAAVGRNCTNVLQHAAVRRMYKGVISIRSKQPGDTGLAMPDAAVLLLHSEVPQTKNDSAVDKATGHLGTAFTWHNGRL